jgi:NADPH-dependent 2,4-dienoyl-CoA reductase/sulfur reductase-like enzyme
VRPCIACNQSCIGGLYTGRIGCTVNPAVGFERTLGDDNLQPAMRRKEVLVVGGGPAGMEAARVAALRGHAVTLAEAEPKLGGALKLAAMAPTRQALGDIIAWLEQEVYRLGVTVRLGTYMEADDVRAEGADTVIIATGSTPRMDGIQISNPGEIIAGIERDNVLSSWDVLRNPKRDFGRDFGRDAVVIDDLGHYEAVAVTEVLASHGVHVTYLTRHNSFAPQMDVALMNVPALQRLSGYAFEQRLRTRAIRIEDDGVVAGPVYLDTGSNRTEKIPADTVVFVSHNRPNRDLYTALAQQGPDVHIIGDGASPRFLATAIREGNMVGRTI